MNCDKNSLLLYAVTDESWLNGRSLSAQVEEALLGGATCIQLREKKADPTHFLEEARALRTLCVQYQVPFLINDNVEIALCAEADGVHIGQSDMALCEARKKLGPDKIIGVSAHTVEQALEAQKNGADYLGVGAVFPTASKEDASEVSLSVLTEICRRTAIPVVAIGGINQQNISALSDSGISGIAVISAIFAQPDIQAAAVRLRELAETIVS